MPAKRRSERARERFEPWVKRVRDNPYIPHEPTARQWAFLLAPETEVGYGGAAGGGKSDALLMGAAMFVQNPSYSALVLRTSFPELKERGGLIPRSQKWWAGTDAHYKTQEKRWYFPSGATLSFGYLATEKDRFQYGSSRFQYIAFDELTQFRQGDYTFLFSRLRRNRGSKIPLRMRMATNPIGPGLDWVESRFISGSDPDRRFIQAKLEHNPHIDQEEYREKSLSKLDPEVRQRLEHGEDWSALDAGTTFKRSLAQTVDIEPAKIEDEVRYWDFAATEPHPGNKDPDWLAGVRFARCTDGSWGVRHVYRTRVGPGDVLDEIQAIAREDGKDVPIMLEVEGGSQAKISIDWIAKQLAGWKVETDNVSSGKEDRAAPLATQWRHGNVWVKRGEWTADYLDEMNGFPGGNHDDQVDASTGAFRFLVDRMEAEEQHDVGRGGAMSGSNVASEATRRDSPSPSSLSDYF